MDISPQLMVKIIGARSYRLTLMFCTKFAIHMKIGSFCLQHPEIWRSKTCNVVWSPWPFKHIAWLFWSKINSFAYRQVLVTFSYRDMIATVFDNSEKFL